VSSLTYVSELKLAVKKIQNTHKRNVGWNEGQTQPGLWYRSG